MLCGDAGVRQCSRSRARGQQGYRPGLCAYHLGLLPLLRAATMILEIADFTVRPGTQSEFGVAAERGVHTIISKAAGFRRHELQHCIETPERFVLLIEWETLENHTVDFRGSAAFVQWREIVGPYFAKPPVVEHFKRI